MLFRKKVLVFFGGLLKKHYLCSAFREMHCEVRLHLGKKQAFCSRFALTLLSLKLGYGVMVTLQILVLPFLVRVRVPQQKIPLSY